jgi:hypothetical protein
LLQKAIGLTLKELQGREIVRTGQQAAFAKASNGLPAEALDFKWLAG